eukprot:1661843-Pleurochrysis_carterae.AAC.1
MKNFRLGGWGAAERSMRRPTLAYEQRAAAVEADGGRRREREREREGESERASEGESERASE